MKSQSIRREYPISFLPSAEFSPGMFIPAGIRSLKIIAYQILSHDDLLPTQINSLWNTVIPKSLFLSGYQRMTRQDYIVVT
jgi:hypothetical protein